MGTTEAHVASVRPAERPSRVPLHAVAQVAVVFWLYALYGGFRNLATGPTVIALRNAERVYSAERFLHIDVERTIQHFALHFSWLISVCSTIYSLTHLAVPAAVLVLLYMRTPARYAVWRDTFLVLLGLALLAFAVFPLMPPHLMPASYHFADTSHFFSVNRGPLRGALGANPDPTRADIWQFSNPYAAMPSLHTTWALWASLAAWPVVRRRWVKGLLLVYPPAMLLSVVVTANHWILDSLVGVVMLGAAYGIARAIDQLRTAPFVWRTWLRRAT